MASHYHFRESPPLCHSIILADVDRCSLRINQDAFTDEELRLLNRLLPKRSMPAGADLRPSSKIYDELQHYKTVIPMNNQQFRAHADLFFPTGLPCASCDTNYGQGWYTVWLPRYDTTHGVTAQAALQDIIDLYFPGGRPSTETTPPSPDPATFAAFPQAITQSAVTMTATTGSDPSTPVMYQFRETSGNPGATTSGWQTSPVYVDSGLTAELTYTYSVRIRDALGNIGAASAPESVTPGSTPVSDGKLTAAARLICNPTARGVTIAAPGNHSVAVYDMAGRLVFSRNGNGPAGYSFGPFRAAHARGVYMVHIVTALQNTRHAVVMVK